MARMAPCPNVNGVAQLAITNHSCNYLSNESAYRNTLLRDRLNAYVAAGHIYTPYMKNFDPGDQYDPGNSTFAAWQAAIIAQGKKLVRVVGDNAP